MKFDKKNANLDWKIEIKAADGSAAPKSDMNEIYSFVQPKNEFNWFYTCGYKWIDPTKETYRLASTMKLSTEGNIQYLKVWGTAQTATDTCRSVAFDEGRSEIVYLFEVS